MIKISCGNLGSILQFLDLKEVEGAGQVCKDLAKSWRDLDQIRIKKEPCGDRFQKKV